MAAKHEFLCIIPDKAGVLEKRMGVRPQHLENLKLMVRDGFWTFGGAMLEDHSASQPPPIKGSVMLATASSSEEVLAQLRKDVYATEVWDLENVQIIPVSG
ncbi:hypothetical protein MMC13_005339 [Lambiella insularis]|nr:hypothetical protein [Lambiella insularis]